MSEPIRVMVVDDEPLARESVRILVAEDPDCELVAEAEDGEAAARAIAERRPQILFLDVRMPRADGFGLLSRLPRELLPIVVFITAHSEYALRAFEENAVDYLLKPFDDQRFATALERAKGQVRSELAQTHWEGLQKVLQRLSAGAEGETREPGPVRRLAIRETGRVYFVDVGQVRWIEGCGNYAALHTARSRHLHRSSLSALEGKLDPRRFVRIHRSTIVNVACVRELRPYIRGEYLVYLTDGTRLKLSRRYRDKLKILLDEYL